MGCFSMPGKLLLLCIRRCDEHKTVCEGRERGGYVRMSLARRVQHHGEHVHFDSDPYIFVTWPDIHTLTSEGLSHIET